MQNGLLSWQQRGMLWLRLVIRLLLVWVVIWLTGRFGSRFFSLFAPFFAALLVVILLDPAVKWIQKRFGWSRQNASLLFVLILFGLLGVGLALLLYVAGREVMDLLQNWEKLFDALKMVLQEFDAFFTRACTLVPVELTEMVEQSAERFLAWLNVAVPEGLGNLGHIAGDTVKEVPSFVVSFLMFLIGTYFIMADYPYMRTRVIQRLDDEFLRLLSQIRATALGAFGGYLRAQILLSVGVFFILLGGFVLTKQPYGLLLAIGLAILDFIPLLGSGTVMVPWAVICLLTRNYRNAIVIMVIWGGVTLFRRAAEPKIVGEQTGLSPILSLVSIYVGMKLAGILGMILGPIFLLLFMNLNGMGMFRGIQNDLRMATRDISRLLAQSIHPSTTK